MNAIRVVGIDIAKSVFQVCVWMNDGTSHGIKNLTLQIAGYRSTIRARNAYRYGGLFNLSFLGKNVQCYGIPRETDSCTTCESLCPQPEERCQR